MVKEEQGICTRVLLTHKGHELSTLDLTAEGAVPAAAAAGSSSSAKKLAARHFHERNGYWPHNDSLADFSPPTNGGETTEAADPDAVGRQRESDQRCVAILSAMRATICR